MYRFKRSILLSLILLISLIFAASSEATRAVVTREEFFAALYDARGIKLTVETRRGGRTVTENLTSARDKAEASFKLGYAGMPNTGIVRASAPASDGRLNVPITRIEAIRYIIQSLGLSFEAFILSRLPSTFADISQLSAFERGCVAVAERMIPPFLNVNEDTFNPQGQITREELARLMGIVRSAVNDLLLELNVSPVRGITIRIHREGTFTGVPRWRLNVHGFESEAEANVAVAQIEGLEMTPRHVNFEWSLRGELLDDWRQVERFYNMLRRLNRHVAIVPSVVNAEGENQPRFWALATISPEFDIRVLTPPTGITTLSTLSQMCRVNDTPILAVNAGYFAWTGRLRGRPIGTLVVDGELANAPYLRRTTIGWSRNNVPIFGYPAWSQRIMLPFSQSATLDRINSFSRDTTIAVFTSLYGIPTPSPGIATTEIFIKDGRCVGKAHGGTIINRGDVILAAYGPRALLLNNINPGDPINVSLRLTSAEGDFNDWGSVTNAIQGGPMLVTNGQVNIRPEGFDNNFVNHRHPRTAVGVDYNGNWLLFVGGGRNGTHSIGYTLNDVALIMQQLGAEHVLNLDGGGSTEMLVRGQLFNWPSEGRERPISTAIGIFE